MFSTLSFTDILTLCLAWLLVQIFIALARRKFRGQGFLDHANSRSLHVGATPKVGGLGLVPAIILALILNGLGALGSGPPQAQALASLPLRVWLLCSVLIFALCYVSDRSQRELSPLLRLSGYLLASSIFAGMLLTTASGGPWLTTPDLPLGSAMNMTSPWVAGSFALFTLLAFTNFFNFMDGMDGLAGSMAIIGFAGMGALALVSGLPAAHGLSISSFCVAVASLGFLIWNWPKAKIFLGDTGSTFLGFSAMALGWTGSIQGLWHWSIPLLLFFPFWFDASVTLTRRLLRGEIIWQAHRDHFYQLAVLSAPGEDLPGRHRAVLLPAIGLMIVSLAVSFLQHFGWMGIDQFAPWPAVLFLGLIHSFFAIVVARRHKKFRGHS